MPIDYSQLSTEDLKALLDNRYDQVSTEGLQYLDRALQPGSTPSPMRGIPPLPQSLPVPGTSLESMQSGESGLTKLGRGFSTLAKNVIVDPMIEAAGSLRDIANLPPGQLPTEEQAAKGFMGTAALGGLRIHGLPGRPFGFKPGEAPVPKVSNVPVTRVPKIEPAPLEHRPPSGPTQTLLNEAQRTVSPEARATEDLLAAAERSQTGKPELDLGEVGRRRAAERVRASKERPWEMPESPEPGAPTAPEAPSGPMAAEPVAPGKPVPRSEGRAARYELDPDQLAVLIESKEPAAQELGHMVQRGALNGAQLRASIHDRADRVLRVIARDSPEDKLVFQVLNGAPLPPDAPQAVRDVVHFLKNEFPLYANILRIPQERRIVDYIPHLFDRDTIIAMLKEERVKFAQDPGTLAHINQVLEEMMRGMTPRYNLLPDHVKMAFLEPRTGAKGFQESALRAWDAYVNQMARYISMNEVNQRAPNLLSNINNLDLADFARKYLMRLNSSQGSALTNIDQRVRNFEFFRTLGFNFRWPFVNSTQMLISAVEDPRAALRGLNWYSTKLGREAYQASGHPSLGMTRFFREGLSAKSEPWAKAATAFGDMVENANRGATWLGTLEREARMTPDQFEAALKGGRAAFPQAALDVADDAVRRTQGFYGKLGNPVFLEAPGLKALLQYQAVPLKIWRWMIANPGKAVGYMALTQGLDEMTRAAGLNFSSQLGWGIDFQGAFSEMRKHPNDPGRWFSRFFNPAVQDIKNLRLPLGPAATLVESGARATKAAVAGAPGGFKKAAAAFGKELLPVAATRAWDAGQNWRAGGGLLENLGTLTGYVPDSAVVRSKVLDALENGHTTLAQKLVTQWKKVSGEDLWASIPAARRAEAVKAGMDLRKQAAAAKRALTSEEHFLQNLPPRLQSALTP